MVKNLVAGCAVYLFVLACSSAGSDGGSVAGQDTGGVTGMNGNAGSSSGDANGTGAVAMAATGGDVGSVTCDCPQPEPDARIEKTCDVAASVGTQKFAALTITGATLGDLSRVRAVYLSGDATPWPSGTVGLVNTVAYGTETIWVGCATETTEKVAFFVPADLAGNVQ